MLLFKKTSRVHGVDFDKYMEHIVLYVIVLVLSVFAGLARIVRTIQKIKGEISWGSVLFRALGDIILSIFAGFIMFFVLQGDSFRPLTYWDAAYIAISAYMGTRAIDIFVVIWENIYNKSEGMKK